MSWIYTGNRWIQTEWSKGSTKQNYNLHIVVLYCAIMEGFSSILNLRRHADYPHSGNRSIWSTHSIWKAGFSPRAVAFLQAASRWGQAIISVHLHFYWLTKWLIFILILPLYTHFLCWHGRCISLKASAHVQPRRMIKIEEEAAKV